MEELSKPLKEEAPQPPSKKGELVVAH